MRFRVYPVSREFPAIDIETFDIHVGRHNHLFILDETGAGHGTVCLPYSIKRIADSHDRTVWELKDGSLVRVVEEFRR